MPNSKEKTTKPESGVRTLLMIKSKLLIGIALIFIGVWPAFGEEGFFDSNGVKIHYVVEGKGPPVVLIHGLAADIQSNWRFPGILKALAARYQVIALDCRGHGKSDKPLDADKYGPAMMEDVNRLLDHLKIKKAHIVGYSMGGGIAMEFVMAHADRVLSAVIGGFGVNTAKEEKTMVKELAESLEKGKGFGPLLIALTPPGAARPSEDQIKAVNTILLSFNDAKAIAACMRGFKKETDLSPDEIVKKLKAGNKPILALVGDLDPFKVGAEELKNKVENAELVVIKDGDHVSALMKADFQKALLAFLKKHEEDK